MLYLAGGEQAKEGGRERVGGEERRKMRGGREGERKRGEEGGQKINTQAQTDFPMP